MTDPTPSCEHPERPPASGRICAHLLGSSNRTVVLVFTGEGRKRDLLCKDCFENGDAASVVICEPCFRSVRFESDCSEIDGNRLEAVHGARDGEIRLLAREVPPLELGPLAGVVPVADAPAPEVLALGRDGRVHRVDLSTGRVELRARLRTDRIPLDRQVELACSRDGRFLAIAAHKECYGLVLDLETGRITLLLNRGDYHVEHCNWPLAFARIDGRDLLVHASDWNRLELSDPLGGEHLSAREFGTRGEPGPEEELNYFHCGLTVSPGGEWIADDGWVWHPYAVVRIWSLRRWLENPWESETDEPPATGFGRGDVWDNPLCWLDDRTLAVFGLAEMNWVPGVRLFDVQLREFVGEFPGPEGELALGPALLSYGWDTGVTAWDVETGARLANDPELEVSDYHPGAAALFRVGGDGGVTLVEVG